MKWAVYAVLVLGGLSCAGCVGAGMGASSASLDNGALAKPVAQFPSQADLNRVPTASAEAPKGLADMKDVEAWQMQAPADEAQYPDTTAWDKLALSANQEQGNRATLSTALRCAAAEAARFYTVNGGMPDDGLRQHLLLRCGSTAPGHSFAYVTGTFSDGMPEARIVASARASVEKLVRSQLAHGGQLGLASARGHGRYAVVSFSAVERALLEPFSPVISGNTVTLKGELKVPASYAVAFVTKGVYGVERCEPDPFVHVPQFHVTCPIAADDTSARIEVASQQEGRVLLEPAVDLEVRRDGHAELEYNAGSYGANKAVEDRAQYRAELLGDLNQVRHAAGLGPFTLEAQQSETDDRFAPALYQSLSSGDAAHGDTIALGLLAGWDVHAGMIRGGGFFVSSVNGSRNPSRWLSQAIASPLGRWVLLEPNMSRIAIGTSELSPVGEMAVVTTYALFDSDDHHGDEAAVIAELDRQRHARGNAPVTRVKSDDGLERALEAVSQNKITVASALDRAMEQFQDDHGHRISGYLVETTDVKQLRFDPLLLDSSTLELELGITHYRAPGAAWGQYAMLFLITGHGASTHMAEGHSRARGAF